LEPLSQLLKTSAETSTFYVEFEEDFIFTTIDFAEALEGVFGIYFLLKLEYLLEIHGDPAKNSAEITYVEEKTRM
jgi:hypothetical protein